MKTEDVGATTFMRACQFGDLGMVLSMLEKGVDVNEQDRNNNTALMYAIINDDGVTPDRTIIINKLIAKGANPNSRNMQFESPTILAAKNNDPKTLNMLLQAGATDFEMMDTVEGKNVYQYAAGNSCKKVMDDFNKNQEPEPTTEAPARRSFLTRILDVLWSPFRVIGSVLKSIAAAIVQLFINRASKPRVASDASEDTNDGYYEMPDRIDNPKTITKLTSKPEPVVKATPNKPEPETKKKWWFDFSKEKKPATRFSKDQIAEMQRQGELKIRGVTPPGSPKSPGQQDI